MLLRYCRGLSAVLFLGCHVLLTVKRYLKHFQLASLLLPCLLTRVNNDGPDKCPHDIGACSIMGRCSCVLHVCIIAKEVALMGVCRNDKIKPQLRHLATPAGTSLVAIQRLVAITLATWDAVWGKYLHPKRAVARMRLCGVQEKVLEGYFKKLKEEATMVSQQRWGTRKQLVMFIGNTGISTRGMNSSQPIEEELDRSEPTRPECWKPQASQVQDPLLRSAWSQRCEAPVLNPMWCLYQATPGINGRWVDRDCNVALNLQHIGDSKWRPLELCRWPHRARLPAKGKEYPGLGVKKLRDRAPKPRPSSL
ncbi:hypothetical protein QJQ45_008950 [Haematococcus lacustris]|nr:hypothetical protein QJQ45_008950 [Haematococcus lacustris]